MRTIAFFSYARRDDKAVNGLLSKIRARLETEAQAYSGEEDLEVFQDTDDVKPGDQWDQRIRDAIDDSAFFLPVLTPFYFKRPYCRKELEIWLSNYTSQREKRRIIPIRFLPLPPSGFDPKTGKPVDKLRDQIGAFQFIDFLPYRNNLSLRGKLSREISELAQQIVERWDER